MRGCIEWTERTAGMIRSREYRYLSPAFLYDKGGRVAVVVGAGPTNTPALDLPTLASTQFSGDSMNEEQLKTLRDALGLAADADAVLAAVAGNKALAQVAEARPRDGREDRRRRRRGASGAGDRRVRAARRVRPRLDGARDHPRTPPKPTSVTDLYRELGVKPVTLYGTLDRTAS